MTAVSELSEMSGTSEASATSATAAPTAMPPVRGLTVLYDANCPLCAYVRGWLTGQRQLVPLIPVPAGSAEARRRFPELDHAATLREITVIGDAGQIYQGQAAWLVCLWALSEYRPLAHRLSTPAGAPFARAAVLAAAKYRQATAGRRGTPSGTSPRTSSDGCSEGCSNGCPVPE